ncbi:MAG: hypothetical protein JW969_16390 [Spirochaetales bacterium]|nr:hypothetical protein [Spirochaetales bacterium]
MNKCLIIFILCALAVNASATDKDFLEIELGSRLVLPLGIYSTSGRYYSKSAAISPFGAIVPLSVLFRIIPGLQAGVMANFVYFNQDWDDVAGFGLPAIEVKYTSEIGLGAFADLNLPFGTEAVVGSNPDMSFVMGLFFDNSIQSYLIYLEISYLFTLEGNDNRKQDSLIIKARPGYQISSLITMTLLIEFDYAFEEIFNGNAVSNTFAYVLAVAPGILLKPFDTLELSLAVPASLVGSNTVAFWGVNLAATLKLF